MFQSSTVPPESIRNIKLTLSLLQKLFVRHGKHPTSKYLHNDNLLTSQISYYYWCTWAFKPSLDSSPWSCPAVYILLHECVSRYLISLSSSLHWICPSSPVVHNLFISWIITYSKYMPPFPWHPSLLLHLLSFLLSISSSHRHHTPDSVQTPCDNTYYDHGPPSHINMDYPLGSAHACYSTDKLILRRCGWCGGRERLLRWDPVPDNIRRGKALTLMK